MERKETEEPLNAGANFWVHNNEVRIHWKLLAYTGVFFLSSFVFLLIAIFLQETDSIAFTISQTAAAFVAAVFCMLLIEKRPIADIGLWLRMPALKAAVFGSVLAAVMVLMVFAVELAAGFLRTTLLAAETDSYILIIIFGAFRFVLIAVGEEVLIRGYPFYILQRRFNGLTAIIATSLVFSVMHITNPSVTAFSLINIFLAGVWLGVARLLSGGLWLPVGLHFGWNFVMGSVLGLPVSGFISASILVTDVAGPQWITGGYFGPEGGVIATVILLAGCAVLLHPAVRDRYSNAESMDS